MQLVPKVPVNIKGPPAELLTVGGMSRGYFGSEYFLVRRRALWR